MFNLKKYNILFLLLCVLCLVFITTNNQIWARCERPFVMVWYEWAPFTFTDSQNNKTGLDSDLIKEIMRKMGCDLEYIALPWNRALSSIENGKVDMLYGASKKPEREKYALFSAPYRNDIAALFVRKGESGRYPIKKVSDLVGSDFRLGINQGLNYGKEFDELMKNPQFKKNIQAITSWNNPQKLAMGRIDGYLGEPISTVENIKELNLIGKIERHPMDSIFIGTIHMMFSKKTTSPETVNNFNDALTKIKNDGTYKDILMKYEDVTH